MTIRVIGLIRLLDPAAFDTYRSQVGATVERFVGRILSRGVAAKPYWNELECAGFEAFVELEFPSCEAADAWAASTSFRLAS